MDAASPRLGGRPGRALVGAVLGYGAGLVVATVGVADVEPTAGVTLAGAVVQLVATLVCAAGAGVAARASAAWWGRAVAVAVPVGSVAYAVLVSVLGHAPGAVVVHGVVVVAVVTATGSAWSRRSRHPVAS